MRTVLRTALAAALLAGAGCSLTIDPDSVEPPGGTKKVTPRGACVQASGAGHKLCGGQISAGTKPVGSSAYASDGAVGASALQVSSSQHKIVRGDVSP